MFARGHRGRAPERPNFAQAFDHSPIVGPSAKPCAVTQELVLVDLTGASWNQIVSWLREADGLRRAA